MYKLTRLLRNEQWRAVRDGKKRKRKIGIISGAKGYTTHTTHREL